MSDKSIMIIIFFVAFSLSRSSTRLVLTMSSFGIIYGVLISKCSAVAQQLRKIKFIVIKFIMSTENKDVCYNVYYNLSTERKLVVKIKTT